MIKLLIIADDFTGSLDTGIQFAMKGIETKITTDTNIDFHSVDESVQVLVIDSESRPMKKEQAYAIVNEISKRGLEAGIQSVFKKTDSALRGNIGSELSALSDAGKGTVHFIPAYPEISRVTKKGIQYIGDTIISESAFGKDPFEPIRYSYIPQIIKNQSSITVECRKPGFGWETKDLNHEIKIVVYDAETNADIIETARKIVVSDGVKLWAGCAGLASQLPDMLGLYGENKQEILKSKGFIVVCGSVNSITREQVDYAVSNGFQHINLDPSQKLSPEYYSTLPGQNLIDHLYQKAISGPSMVIDSFDYDENITREYAQKHGIPEMEMRMRIASTLGVVIKGLIDRGLDYTYLVTGGDTLMGFMNQVHNAQLKPIIEIEQGSVVSKLKIGDKYHQIISKSGGFGNKETLVSIAKKVTLS